MQNNQTIHFLSITTYSIEMAKRDRAYQNDGQGFTWQQKALIDVNVPTTMREAF